MTRATCILSRATWIQWLVCLSGNRIFPDIVKPCMHIFCNVFFHINRSVGFTWFIDTHLSHIFPSLGWYQMSDNAIQFTGHFECLFKGSFKLTATKKTSVVYATCSSWGNPPVTNGFPSQRNVIQEVTSGFPSQGASNAKRHFHIMKSCLMSPIFPSLNLLGSFTLETS